MLFNALARFHYFFSDFYGYIFILIFSFFLLLFLLHKVFKSKDDEIKKRFHATLLFSVFAAIVIFICFEAFFRYKYDESDSLGFLQTNQRWLARHVVHNNYFFRDRNFEIKKPNGVTRIGVVGDSMTFGYGISDPKDRFTDVLEKDLRAKGKNVQVYNLGIPGLDTCGEVDEFNKIKNIQIDIIVWEYYLNDIQPCGDQKSTGGKILSLSDPRIGLEKFLSSKSFFFDYMYWKIAATHKKVFTELRLADVAQYSNKPVVEEEEKSVAALSTLLKGDDGQRKVIGIIFPFFFLMGPNYPAKSIHVTVEKWMQDNGIYSVIDLYDSIKDKTSEEVVANQFDYHPNKYVHQIVAQKLEEKILPLLH